MRPKISLANVVLLLVTTISKFQIFCHNLCSFRNTLMSYVCNDCDQAADMVRIAPVCWAYEADFSLAIHEAVLLKLEAVQIIYTKHR